MKFCTALKKRIFELMKIPTEGIFRYAGTHITIILRVKHTQSDLHFEEQYVKSNHDIQY